MPSAALAPIACKPTEMGPSSRLSRWFGTDTPTAPRRATVARGTVRWCPPRAGRGWWRASKKPGSGPPRRVFPTTRHVSTARKSRWKADEVDTCTRSIGLSWPLCGAPGSPLRRSHQESLTPVDLPKPFVEAPETGPVSAPAARRRQRRHARDRPDQERAPGAIDEAHGARPMPIDDHARLLGRAVGIGRAKVSVARASEAHQGPEARARDRRRVAGAPAAVRVASAHGADASSHGGGAVHGHSGGRRLAEAGLVRCAVVVRRASDLADALR
jgi:hypothetical protein